MNHKPPLIRLAYRDDDGDLQLMGTLEMAEIGCVPSVGDIFRDTLVEWWEPYRVRRRVFIKMTAEPDVWWILLDRLPDDPEIDALVAFDAEIREEFKAIERENAAEESKARRKRLRERASND